MKVILQLLRGLKTPQRLKSIKTWELTIANIIFVVWKVGKYNKTYHHSIGKKYIVVDYSDLTEKSKNTLPSNDKIRYVQMLWFRICCYKLVFKTVRHQIYMISHNSFFPKLKISKSEFHVSPRNFQISNDKWDKSI